MSSERSAISTTFTPIDPYRLLFPMGVVFALVGAALWPFHTLGWIPYPGPLHITLMMQGFEQCFVLGFLLTAMPAFTHGPRCHPVELSTAVVAMLAFGGAAFAGGAALAQVAFLVSILLLGIAGIRRVAGAAEKPPEEFLFVGFGLLSGATGSGLMLAHALGADIALPARFAERLLSLGMVLSLVLGVGSLLVPTFAGIPDPLRIAGVAGPHQRPGRRLLYASVMVVLALAFFAELVERPRLGMSMRAAAAVTMGLWVWKLTHLPRRDVPGFALWLAGWMVMGGVLAAALDPVHGVAGLHLTFIGGFALLTMGIGTRVAVTHGKQPLAVERRVLDVPLVSLLLLALALRVAADLVPGASPRLLAASGLSWILAWGGWIARVWRRGSKGASPDRRGSTS